MLASVVRSGLVEARHHGAVAVVDRGGRLTHRFGDVERPFFIRSAAKPFQAAVCVRLGATVSLEELAVGASSHGGDPVQIALTRRMLEAAGLDETALGCPPDWPASPRAARRLVGSGRTRPRGLWHNCSGKHALMLAATVANGWEVAGYLRPDHPLQQAIADEMASVFGPGSVPVGVDGCGAPTFRGSALGLAGAFARLVGDPAYATVVEAIGRYPSLTSAPGAADAPVMVWLGGVSKRGAEGCLGIGLPGRGGIGIKVWDGSARALPAVVFRVLDRLGWIPGGARSFLESTLTSPVLGGGREVGGVRPAVELERL